jgi:hypothetical protein
MLLYGILTSSSREWLKTLLQRHILSIFSNVIDYYVVHSLERCVMGINERKEMER